MRNALRRGTVAVAILVSLSPSHAAPPVVEPCAQFAASPDFATDHIAYCAGHLRDRTTGNTTGIAVYRTVDGGRTWTKAAAAGLAHDAYARVRHLSVVDGELFIQVGNSGLFQSTDGGDTFSLIGPLAWGYVTPFVATAPATLLPLPSAGSRALFAMALDGGEDGDPNKSAIIDPLTRSQSPVVGTPARDRAFAVPDTFAQDGTAFAVADRGIGLDARVEVYRCDGAFVCDDLLYAFPQRWTFDRIWLSRSFATTRTVYVSTRSLNGHGVLWWSRDAGRTWSRWQSAERLLTPVVRAKGYPLYALATGPARTLYLRLSYRPDAGRSVPPAEQLYRSADGGATWTLVAYGRTAEQRGPRGVMPTDSPLVGTLDGIIPSGALTVAGQGTLFTLGKTGSYAGLYCSWDGGRRWQRTCR